VKFRAGSSYLQTNGTLYPAVELIGHPLFDYYTLDYDVGLGKVSENVVQNVIKKQCKFVSKTVYERGNLVYKNKSTAVNSWFDIKKHYKP